MNTTQGKKFNRVGEVETGAKIMPGQQGFNSVHSIGQGYGYRWSREVMMEWFRKFEDLVEMGRCDHVILMAHVKDKLQATKTGDVVSSLDINLTGRVKQIWAAKADAIGYMYADENVRYISFNASSKEKVLAGPRQAYLAGKTIKVSESNKDGKITHYWEEIFPSLN